MSSATPTEPPNPPPPRTRPGPNAADAAQAPAALTGSAEAPGAPARPRAAGPLLSKALRRASGRRGMLASLGRLGDPLDPRELRARIEALERQRDEAQELRAELAERQARCEALTLQRAEQAAELAQRDARSAALSEQIARTQDDVAALRAEQAALGDALAAARATLASEQAALQRLSHSVAEHERSVGARDAELGALRAELAASQERSRLREEEIARLHQSLREREARLDEQQRTALELRERLRQGEERSGSLAGEVERLEQALGEARGEARGALREAADLRRALASHAEHAQRRDEEMAGLRQALATRQERDELRDEEVAALRQSLESARRAADAQAPRTEDPALAGLRAALAELEPTPEAAAEPFPGDAPPPAAARDALSIAESADLPPIHHYWRRGQIVAKLGLPDVSTTDDFFLHYLLEVCRRHPRETVPIVSVGTGSRDLEVVLARRALDAGVRNFNLHCLAPGPSRVSRDRAVALEPSVLSHLTLVQCGAVAWPAEPRYRLCILNASLHQLDEPEAWLERISAALAPQGRVVVSTPIGRPDRVDSPVAQEIAAQIWQLMPERYRATRAGEAGEGRDDPAAVLRSRAAARAPAILPLLMDAFHFEVFAAFGNVIHAFIDADLGPNFDPASERDRRFIDQLAALDDARIDAGLIPPTQLLAVMRAEPVEGTRVYRQRTPELCLGYGERALPDAPTRDAGRA